MSYEGMKCFNCGELFSGKANAKYCSARCRVAANRNKVEAVSVTAMRNKGVISESLRRTLMGDCYAQPANLELKDV